MTITNIKIVTGNHNLSLDENVNVQMLPECDGYDVHQNEKLTNCPVFMFCTFGFVFCHVLFSSRTNNCQDDELKLKSTNAL